MSKALEHSVSVSNPATVSAPPFLLGGGDNFRSQILKRGESEKNECLGGLKEFLSWAFVWGACYVSSQKKT